MRILVVTTILLSLSSCGSEQKVKIKTDPILEPYVKEFFDILKENNVKTPNQNYAELKHVKLSVSPEKHLYGKCRIDENKEEISSFHISSKLERTVIIYPNNINRDFPKAGKDIIRLVVFHELIHCIFDREHDHENTGIMATDIREILDIYKGDVDELVDYSLQLDYISGLNRIKY